MIMGLELRQSLNLTQQLIMTPQLQQAIKLLQLSRLELLDTIYEEMEVNPALEEQPSGDSENEGIGLGPEDYEQAPSPASEVQEVKVEERARDDVDWDSYISEYSTTKAPYPYEEKESIGVENMIGSQGNLYSHLLWQLNMSNLTDFQRNIGVCIIENLNEDGYLDATWDEIIRDGECSREEAAAVLETIQKFDPVGVASVDMRECLLIQAGFQGLSGTVVEKIIENHLVDLENRKYDRIAKKLGIKQEEVFAAIGVIQSFDPKPGRQYLNEETIYITPDIYVIKVGDDYEILQNEDGLPKLRVSSYYRDVLREGKEIPENARTYLQEKLRSAAWLIKSIHQRQRTIYKVTESIVKFQCRFLDKGVTELKPMVLRDVAEDIGMHESTVSRVTTNKYVHTPQGLFELKYFFNSSIRSFDGDSFASESVKEHIRNIIKAEDRSNPRSDQEIAEMLIGKNINVARRTVAKYREAMGMLPSRKRKVLF
jgi:RNA polymerase sigma-54 factor